MEVTKTFLGFQTFTTVTLMIEHILEDQNFDSYCLLQRIFCISCNNFSKDSKPIRMQPNNNIILRYSLNL